jgi:UDP-N-acetylmuramoyl-L-alanyl-D-glutamate--2,6-diaminopimelate ligase
MNLEQAINTLDVISVHGDLNRDVTGVCTDSREVITGTMFVAVRGSAADGNTFVPQAILSGASAIVSESEKPTDNDDQVCWIHVADARAAAAALACNWYDHPSAGMKVVGITGTNGKTTTAFITHAIMEQVWRRAGLLGTVQVNDGEEVVAATHTTPGSVELQSILARMSANDCRGVAMEISSHALEQKRTDGLEMDVAVFTNLSQDHLDYHGNMAAYFAAKRRIFELLENQTGNKKTTAVINLDDPYGQRLIEEFKDRLYILSYGYGVHADIRIGREHQTVRGSEFDIKYKDRDYLVRTPYIGRFNIYNGVAALAASVAVGIKVRDVIAALAEAPQVPGRLENIGSRDGAAVFVDYAHTPDALVNVCAAIRELKPKRLITVFGCGGDRDVSKRPMMGAAASKASDFCIVTSDNPRSEKPEIIMAQIEKGISGERYQKIEDRMDAIQTAVNLSEEGDIVLVAGKGHETYQEVEGERTDFDDRRAAYKAMNLKKTIV